MIGLLEIIYIGHMDERSNFPRDIITVMFTTSFTARFQIRYAYPVSLVIVANGARTLLIALEIRLGWPGESNWRRPLPLLPLLPRSYAFLMAAKT